MRDEEHLLTFSLASFILMHFIPPSPSWVEHLSFPISRHQSLYPCWVKNGTHYLWHALYRNGILFTDKREVKQLTVVLKAARRRRRRINDWRALGNFHTVNTRQKLGKRRRIFRNNVGNVYTQEKDLLPPPYYYHKRLIAEVAVADKSVFRILLVKLNWDKMNHSALFFFNDCEKKHL